NRVMVFVTLKRMRAPGSSTEATQLSCQRADRARPADCDRQSTVMKGPNAEWFGTSVPDGPPVAARGSATLQPGTKLSQHFATESRSACILGPRSSPHHLEPQKNAAGTAPACVTAVGPSKNVGLCQRHHGLNDFQRSEHAFVQYAPSW